MRDILFVFSESPSAGARNELDDNLKLIVPTGCREIVASLYSAFSSKTVNSDDCMRNDHRLRRSAFPDPVKRYTHMACCEIKIRQTSVPLTITFPSNNPVPSNS